MLPNILHHRVVLWILLLVSTEGQGSGISYDLYSESSYRSLEKVYTNSARVRAELKNRSVGTKVVVTPYLIEGIDEARDGFVESLYGYSYAFAGLGGKISILPGLYGLVEQRARLFYGDDLPKNVKKFDSRFLLVFGDYRSLIYRPQFSVFSEIYHESLVSSADYYNVTTTTISRVGPQKRYLSFLRSSIFLESFYSRDARGYFYFNKFELKPTFRTTLLFDKFALGISLSRNLSFHLRRRGSPKSPYGHRNTSTNILVTGGGVF